MKKSCSLIISILLLSINVWGQVWVQKANFGGVTRIDAAGFSIGTKGYIGTGSNCSGTKLNDFWQWDQTTNAWTQKASVGGPGRQYAVGFSIGSKGYIGTGLSTVYQNDLWEYDPSANTWTQKANFAGTARYLAQGFSIGSKGYIGGGHDGSSPQSDFWEYDPSTNAWSQKANFGGGMRYAGVGFSIGNKGYMGTGNDNTGPYFADFWEYDPTLNNWVQKANFPGTPRDQAFGFGVGIKGFIGSGRDNVNPYFAQDFWEYDQPSNTWSQKSGYGQCYRGVSFVIGTSGYCGTGYNSLGCSNSFYEYTPTCVNSPAQPGTITGSAIVCNGSTTTYSITAVSGATSYTWVLPGGWAGTSTTTSISATAGSTGGTISVTANNACGSSIAQSVVVTVDNLSATTSSTFTTCGTCCDGTATGSASGGFGPYSYIWSPSGGNLATASGLCTGTYTFCVTDANGCTTCQTVNVSFNVGIQELNSLDCSVYPNPFNENIIVQLNNLNVTAFAEIWDLLGEKVFASHLTSQISNLDLSKLQGGIYFVRITTNEGSVTKKIVKE